MYSHETTHPSRAGAKLPREAPSGIRPHPADAMATYRDNWLRAVVKDKAVSGGAWLVASAIAGAMRSGRVAPTDWQKLNAALRRDRMDPAVLASISELQAAGFLELYPGNGAARTAGWRLTLPEEGRS